MLFIPGFMQRGDAWRPVAELLPERYPSVLLDHAEHTFERRLGEIAEAGAGRVLVGYSLGGRLALRAALRDPERYAGVVVLGATAGIEEPSLRSARAEADGRLAAWMEVTPIEDIVSIWERQPLFADQPETLVEEQRAGPPRAEAGRPRDDPAHRRSGSPGAGMARPRSLRAATAGAGRGTGRGLRERCHAPRRHRSARALRGDRGCRSRSPSPATRGRGVGPGAISRRPGPDFTTKLPTGDVGASDRSRQRRFPCIAD